MNKAVIKELLHLLVFTLFLAGCKKDAQTRYDTQGSKLTVVKAKANSENHIQNVNLYNESGNIQTRISYKDYTSALVGSKTTYQYEDGRLVQKEEQVDISGSSAAVQYYYNRSVLEYSGNRVIQKNDYLKTGSGYELRSFTVFAYDGAEHPVKQTLYSADGALLGYTVYTYEGNNVVLREEYNTPLPGTEPVLTFKHSYKHDNGKNPYGNVYHKIENIPFSVNENNITETIAVSYSGNSSSPGETSTTSLTTYVYNNSGYPVLMNENGNVFILEYQ